MVHAVESAEADDTLLLWIPQQVMADVEFHVHSLAAQLDGACLVSIFEDLGNLAGL